MKADWKQVQFYRFHYIMLTFTLSSREPYLLYSFKMTLIVVGNKANLFCEFVCVFDYRWFCFVSTNPRCQNKYLITGKQCIYLGTNALFVLLEFMTKYIMWNSFISITEWFHARFIISTINRLNLKDPLYVISLHSYAKTPYSLFRQIWLFRCKANKDIVYMVCTS